MLSYAAAVSIAIVAVLLIWIGFTFNRFVRHRNLAQEAWSGVDVQLKRRHDLIPRLVECVKGYRGYEASVLEKLTQARAQAQIAIGALASSQAETGVTQTLRTFLGVVEAYPDLKAGRNFQDLSAALIETEDQLHYARLY